MTQIHPGTVDTFSRVVRTESADDILATHGRTFHWAKRFLGYDMGANAAQLYVFCRHVDDIADGNDPNRAARLEAIDTILSGKTLSRAKDAKTARTFVRFAGAHGIDLQVTRDLIRGLASDQGEVNVHDTRELLVYCYRVAGTVGLMMAPLLNCHDRKAGHFAMDLGIAMQLTNIARDVAEDAAMGRRYIPAGWCGQASPRAIHASVFDDTHPARREISCAIEDLLALADMFYASGYKGLSYLPPRAHLAIGIAARCYQEIGHKLRRRKYAYWRGRVVVGTGGKIIASAKSLFTFLHRLGPLPDHDNTLQTYFDPTRNDPDIAN